MVVKTKQHKRDVFHEDEGFTTVGMVLALLITLSLIFTAAQVYQIQSTSADVQNVADAAALAAENEVAEFIIVVRLCDALILSMSLTGIVTLGLGVAALCVPATASLSSELIELSSKIIKARDSFAEKAAAGLNRLQVLLPFFSAAQAMAVIDANSGGPVGTAYFGFAILLPYEGEPIEVGGNDGASELIEQVGDSKADIEEAAQEAEEAAREAKEEKQRAFDADCGNNPGYCMYERAGSLAGLAGSDNPLYHSVDTWSFSVALKRAQAYYPARLAQEKPSGNAVDEKARSALRTRFYTFAVREVERGSVHDDDSGFTAIFPKMPKNTAEMRTTELYTEAVYPVSVTDGGSMMHAWEGCPGIASGTPAGLGSVAQMEADSFATCSQCDFSASSLGKVAAASTAIDNGFEYHYNIVADAAAAYQKARERYQPQANEVKSLVGSIFDTMKTTLESSASHRLTANPPGHFGALAFAADISAIDVSQRFPSSFVQGGTSLGTRAALSAATLASDSPEEGKTVITSLLDNVRDSSSVGGLGGMGVVLDLWSSILFVYANGIESFEQGIEDALSAIPFIGDSGLGEWAAKAFSEMTHGLGLQPAALDSPKPVLVNSAHVLKADSSSFAELMLEAKSGSIELGGAVSSDFFSTVLSLFEMQSLEALGGIGDSVEIAVIEPFGEGGPSLPITIAVPPAATSAAGDAIEGAVDAMKNIYAQAGGDRPWE